jgi:hypothetical protein
MSGYIVFPDGHVETTAEFEAEVARKWQEMREWLKAMEKVVSNDC